VTCLLWGRSYERVRGWAREERSDERGRMAEQDNRGEGKLTLPVSP
jgi:hypothetical protein